MSQLQEIISSLSFLERYGFTCYVHSGNNNITISFYKAEGCITYHEYLQFGDCAIYVSDSLEDFNKRQYRSIYGIGWFCDNVLHELKKKIPKKDYSFLDTVSYYLFKELQNSSKVFDIPAN